MHNHTELSVFDDCKLSLDVKANALSLARLFFKRSSVSNPHFECASLICAAMFEHLTAGNTCLPLAVLCNRKWFVDDETNSTSESALYDIANTQAASGIFIAKLPQFEEALNILLSLNSANSRPYRLVKRYEALYFAHYDELEAQLAHQIRSKLKQWEFAPRETVAPYLKALFPKAKSSQNPNEVDWQAQAVANCLNWQFSIINGGPGTGKTYTAARLLALVRMHKPNFRIMLTAPTGKAAQKLGDSIVRALDEVFATSEISHQDLNNSTRFLSVQTVHRLLGINPSRAYRDSAKYHEGRTLECDLLIVDEVSMLDAHLALQLLKACDKQTRIVFLGDDAQLPAVEAGNLLGELVALSSALSAQHQTPFMLTLKNNYRSSQRINALATSIQEGDFNKVISELNSCLSTWPAPLNSMWEKPSDPALETKSEAENSQARLTSVLNFLSKHHFSALEHAPNVGEALLQFQRLRLLSPLRKGRFGVEGLNKHVVQSLGYDNKRHIPSLNAAYSSGDGAHQVWHKGLPIMVTQNDRANGLNNGDIGMVWPNAQGELLAFFLGAQGTQTDELKAISRYRLPQYELAYAMTIHKSQGSEFEQVIVILPDKPSPLCQRELLFTGVTRAKSSIAVLSGKEVLKATLKQRLHRDSHLCSRILNQEN
ncbi:exodeoxyribonuclease V subunit alpha [Ningiella sp. W23]|uniref:exodeoxyribonuclease V subunit alpha n=1 Tax=Ningiella sp. W23 TaxID=3023715 RepID=UPI003757F4EF